MLADMPLFYEETI